MQSSADTVIIQTTFKAPIEEVWKAWTIPSVVLNWFGSDPNGRGVHAEMDVKAGGRYEISFQDSDQTEHTCSGVYLQVKPFSDLSFTWTWKNEPGVESVVNVRLNSRNQQTEMVFEHAKVGTTSVHDYVAGWRSTFSKLEQLLAGDHQENN